MTRIECLAGIGQIIKNLDEMTDKDTVRIVINPHTKHVAIVWLDLDKNKTMPEEVSYHPVDFWLGSSPK